MKESTKMRKNISSNVQIALNKFHICQWLKTVAKRAGHNLRNWDQFSIWSLNSASVQ